MAIKKTTPQNSPDPRHKSYDKFRKDPLSKTPQRGDKTIRFDTTDAGKTYTKTVYKRVGEKRTDRVAKKDPYARFGSDTIIKRKTVSANKALRQATRLSKRPENKSKLNNESAPKKNSSKETSKSVGSAAPAAAKSSADKSAAAKKQIPKMRGKYGKM
jgi:hypothetical protein